MDEADLSSIEGACRVVLESVEDKNSGSLLLKELIYQIVEEWIDEQDNITVSNEPYQVTTQPEKEQGRPPSGPGEPGSQPKLSAVRASSRIRNRNRTPHQRQQIRQEEGTELHTRMEKLILDETDQDTLEFLKLFLAPTKVDLKVEDGSPTKRPRVS